jgi:acyl-CoA synthetase (AMP-forming)/AMP-acid ligase II
MPIFGKEPLKDYFDEPSNTQMSSFTCIASILRFRAARTPKAVALTTLDPRNGKDLVSFTYEKLNSRAEKVHNALRERAYLRKSDKIILFFRRSEVVELAATFFGCIFAGLIPVCVPVPVIPSTGSEEKIDMTFVLAASGAKLAITSQATIKTVGKDIEAAIDAADAASTGYDQYQGAYKENAANNDPAYQNPGSGILFPPMEWWRLPDIPSGSSNARKKVRTAKKASHRGGRISAKGAM